MKSVLPKMIVLATAVLFGVIEATHVTFGPPTLWVWIANYHLPLAGITLAICFLAHQLRMIPAWMITEDLVYWLTSYFTGRTETLTTESWVSMGLGGVHFTDHMFLPTTYIIILMAWIAYEYLWFRYASK